jgi:hypothetical protein
MTFQDTAYTKFLGGSDPNLAKKLTVYIKFLWAPPQTLAKGLSPLESTMDLTVLWVRTVTDNDYF